MKEEIAISDAKERLKELILNKGLKWGEGLMKNGNIPKWIFDLREIILTPEGSRLVSRILYEKIKDLDFDMVGGPSIAAEPLVSSLIMHFYGKGDNVLGFIVRKQPNNFGLRKKVEGPISKRKKVVLIDDAINSGAGMIDAIEAIKTEGCEIAKIITLLDFFKSGHHKLEENYSVDYIFNIEDFGLELNHTYNYKKIESIKEIPAYGARENTLKKLNLISDDKICDFKFYGNLVLVGYKNGSVCCFDETNYSIRWSHQFGESMSAPLLIDNDTALVFIYSGLRKSALFFLNIHDGKVLAKIKFNGNVQVPAGVSEEFYLIGSNKKLYCVSRKEKDIFWDFEADEAINAKPVFDESGNIYACSSKGTLYCLDNSGNLLWKRHLGKEIKSIPLFYGNNIIIKSSENVIFSLDKNNGNLNWLHELKNEALEFKAINNKLVIGCVQGYLLSINADNGNIEDCFKVSNHDITEINMQNNRMVLKTADGRNYII